MGGHAGRIPAGAARGSTSATAQPSRRAALTALVLVAGCALATRPPGGPLAPGDHSIALAHDGRARSYLLHLPPQAVREALPVVLVFHGAAGDAVQNRAWLGLDPYADREGFIVVYPDGTGPLPRRIHMWNAGACCGSAQWGKVDDVGFVLAVLDDLATRTSIDATRVYATGFSNGGMLTYRLAAEASDRFAAIAPVAGTSRAPLDARVRPMPVMHVHSVDDGVVPYGGGTTPIVPFLVTIRHPVVEDVVRAWARHDGCPEQPVAEAPVVRRAGEPDARHTATRLVWQPCASGAEVALWRLTGPGHVWPGPPPTYPRWLIGPPSGVIDVREEMWRFFRRFTRPEAVAFSRGRRDATPPPEQPSATSVRAGALGRVAADPPLDRREAGLQLLHPRVERAPAGPAAKAPADGLRQVGDLLQHDGAQHAGHDDGRERRHGQDHPPHRPPPGAPSTTANTIASGPSSPQPARRTPRRATQPVAHRVEGAPGPHAPSPTVRRAILD